jgi:hypothetical protein
MARAAARTAQFALPLDWSAAGSNDPPLVIGACNAEALRYLAQPATWPVGKVVLAGPSQSGRSLIGRIFARSTGGRVIDGPDSVSEEDMFHAWNAAQDGRGPLLIIADSAPSVWDVQLPDLRSRLAAVPVLHIGAPDDAYARDYIETLFAQRGLAVGADVADFIVRRMHRSHANLARIVDVLDAASLARSARIGKRLAGDVLRSEGLISDDLVDQAGGAS